MGEKIAGVGVCPVGCRLTLPFQKPQGRLAFFVACQPCLQLTFFPPSPRPALAERSSPAGRGRFFCFLMQGASPLASPGLNPNGTGAGGEPRARRGGVPSLLPADLAVPEAAGAACLLCRLSTLPLAYVLSPIPLPPFPTGRGRFFVFLCKGLRPLHPRD